MAKLHITPILEPDSCPTCGVDIDSVTGGNDRAWLQPCGHQVTATILEGCGCGQACCSTRIQLTA